MNENISTNQYDDLQIKVDNRNVEVQALQMVLDVLKNLNVDVVERILMAVSAFYKIPHLSTGNFRQGHYCKRHTTINH